MRKKTMLGLIRNLECRRDEHAARLKVLECDHEVVAVEHGVLSMCCLLYGSKWQLVCSKCDKVIQDITEQEYLEMKLDSDRERFLDGTNKMEARLAVLVAEDAAETSS